MKTHGEVNVRLHAFLISTLDGDEWSISQPGLSIREERATLTNMAEDGVAPRTYLGAVIM
jgi:hypothetical protein